MAVRAKKGWKRGPKTDERATTCASDILKPEHPVHQHFIDWCGESQATKRKARAFLQAFPHYRESTPV
jgi:hypothetical protein